MTYRLGRHSLRELRGVNEKLVEVVELAITITSQDFTVLDGVRTLKEQRELVKSGASRTLRSKHLTGDAVDLVPYINGKLRWEWPAVYKVAEAMYIAAEELNTNLRWGGVWDTLFLQLNPENLENEVERYVKRRTQIGRTAFLDGVHFEVLT